MNMYIVLVCIVIDGYFISKIALNWVQSYDNNSKATTVAYGKQANETCKETFVNQWVVKIIKLCLMENY